VLRRDKRPGRRGEAFDYLIRTQAGTSKRQVIANARALLGVSASLTAVAVVPDGPGVVVVSSGVTASDAWAVLTLSATATVTYTFAGSDQGAPVSAPVKVRFEVVA
jgi:hypothetical protein